MTPIHELLGRIRHDPDFSQAVFELGYLDRCDPKVQRVALELISFPEHEKRVFAFVDEAGVRRRIPFHRIREVYRDGVLIWQRPKSLLPIG
jgi:uncharacterized protein (UPF0248 family)